MKKERKGKSRDGRRKQRKKTERVTDREMEMKIDRRKKPSKKN